LDEVRNYGNADGEHLVVTDADVQSERPVALGR
jgi:hypothetical protein